jgi:two-component system response regulator YesN
MKTDALIKRSYNQKISLDSIAKELGITPSYLSMIYKKANGVTFSQRLSEIRLEKAKELLATSELSAAEISELSGLGDESNLRKRFKKKLGISIREYRNISKEQTLYHKKPERDEQK